ncbi:MAG: deoxyribodipyrimidine photolyase [Myxococcales bacterium]|nr:deoxyribodipyrimidine photolyase [Myxococcales bacterium]
MDFAGLPEHAPHAAQTVPSVRLRELNQAPPRPGGKWVLYWMQGQRRARYNFALQHARDLARVYQKPLLVLETLRQDEPWASGRFHRFVLEGMADNAAAFARGPACYAARLAPTAEDERQLVEALGARACAVVADGLPASPAQRIAHALAPRLEVAMVEVDGHGLLPLRRTSKPHATARGFRRVLHELAPESFAAWPRAAPLRCAALPPLTTPVELRERWPALCPAQLQDLEAVTSELPFSGSPGPCGTRGGSRGARARLAEFVATGVGTYGAERNHPDDEGGSGLSPYLHFGHIATHEVLRALELHPHRFEPARAGKREGFWGAPEDTEAFLDELLTWRELALNAAAHLPYYAQYRSLPGWARATLEAHASDPRPALHGVAQLAAGETGDPVWNAAQRQLRTEGTMHGYLRMLWGKRILEWTACPQEAFEVMVELNNRYALDGRDPSSYAGIAWVLGRYDRAWGPERPIFGTVRYMSSRNTRRKLRLDAYLQRYGAAD